MGMERIITCSKELVTSALAHFKSEESAMDAILSPSFARHRHLHAEMIESLKDISSGLEERRIRSAMELMKFVDGRLTFHLNVEDAAVERDLGI
jgi:hemerythrin-like metal-binding protein